MKKQDNKNDKSPGHESVVIPNKPKDAIYYPGEFPLYIEELFEKPGPITMEDIKKLSPEELRGFNEAVNNKLLQNLKGVAKDKLIEKIEPICNSETKYNFWYSINIDIRNGISSLLQENNRMPSVWEISEYTGYSLKSIRSI